MKAIVFEKPGDESVLKVKEIARPEPSGDQVLVKIHVVGVNPVETIYRSGLMGQMKSPYHILGCDAGGVVESVGPDVTKFKKGDRVWTFYRENSGLGTYAEFCAIPEIYVFPLPANSSFKDAAALGVPYMTAADSLASSKPGETVLVHGASGGVGLPAVQFARNYGMTVIGTASTEEGLKLVRESGAHYALNHRSDDYAQKIAEITKGKGPDVILEMLANVNLQKDLDMIAMDGRIVVIGSRGNVEISPFSIMMKAVSIVGVVLLFAPQERVQRHAARINAGLEQGWLKPVVGKEYTMQQAPEAHREQMQGKAKGKITINIC
eukprot:gene15709-17294_t